MQPDQSQEAPEAISVAPVRMLHYLEWKEEEEEEENPGKGPSRRPLSLTPRKAKAKPKREDDEDEEDIVTITTRPLKMTEIRYTPQERLCMALLVLNFLNCDHTDTT